VIKLDKSSSSYILVTCTRCPGVWFGYADAGNIPQGWAVGANHEKALHPGETQAQDNLAHTKWAGATLR